MRIQRGIALVFCNSILGWVAPGWVTYERGLLFLRSKMWSNKPCSNRYNRCAAHAGSFTVAL